MGIIMNKGIPYGSSIDLSGQLTKTLPAGQTTLVFESPYIKSGCNIQPFVDEAFFGTAYPSKVETSEGTCTFTFDSAYDEDIPFGIRIVSNIEFIDSSASMISELNSEVTSLSSNLTTNYYTKTEVDNLSVKITSKEYQIVTSHFISSENVYDGSVDITSDIPTNCVAIIPVSKASTQGTVLGTLVTSNNTVVTSGFKNGQTITVKVYYFSAIS